MKIYQMTFMDLERGKVIHFARNKEDVKTEKRRREELRPCKLLLEEYVEIPESKDELIDWLNKTIGELQ